MNASTRLQAVSIASLLGAALVLAWIGIEPAADEATIQEEVRGSRIFPDSPTSLRLAAPNASCRYFMNSASWERNCADSMDSKVRVASERIAMATRMRAEREFAVTPSAMAEMGLDAPLLILEGETLAGPFTLRFGALAPDNLSRYAYWNERNMAITVPDFHFRNLAALLPEGGIPR